MSLRQLIGIEIGGTKLQGVLGDSRGEILNELQVAADAAGGAPAILRQLESLVRQLIASAGESVARIGIGFGGPVDSETGTTILSNHVAGWERVSLTDWSMRHFNLPCTVGNDTDVAAIAEARCGAGKHDHCVFYTNIGSGIGGGLVVEGRLYARPHGAMEVGHSRVYSELEGRHGILEDFCSGWSLDRRARAAAKQHRDSLLWELAEGDAETIDAAILFAAWLRQDDAATRVVEDFLDCHARTMANVIALLNPDVIILGGGVAGVGTPLLEAIRTRLARYVYAPFAELYRVELAALGPRAVPVGALLLAADPSGPDA
jgi:glucokinase